MEQTAIAVAGKAPASSSTVCDWTELPADLLVRIFGTLQIPDLLSSGSVCRSWRCSHMEARRFRLCSPHQSPCLVYSATDRDHGTATLHYLNTDKLYHVVTLPDPAFRSRYVMGSSRGWLVTADERSNLILLNPVTGAQIVMPPPERKLCPTSSCVIAKKKKTANWMATIFFTWTRRRMVSILN
jgi:hypothetical protein